jgi:hypothetical protein
MFDSTNRISTLIFELLNVDIICDNCSPVSATAASLKIAMPGINGESLVLCKHAFVSPAEAKETLSINSHLSKSVMT